MSCYLSWFLISYTHNKRKQIKQLKNIELDEEDKEFLIKKNKSFNVLKIVNMICLLAFGGAIGYIIITFSGNKLWVLPMLMHYIIAIICEGLCGFYKLKKGAEL